MNFTLQTASSQFSCPILRGPVSTLGVGGLNIQHPSVTFSCVDLAEIVTRVAGNWRAPDHSGGSSTSSSGSSEEQRQQRPRGAAAAAHHWALARVEWAVVARSYPACAGESLPAAASALAWASFLVAPLVEPAMEATVAGEHAAEQAAYACAGEDL